MNPDPYWQVTAMASVISFAALGLALRRLIARFDRRRR